MIETEIIAGVGFSTEKLQNEIHEFLIHLSQNHFEFLDIKLDVKDCWACVIYSRLD